MSDREQPRIRITGALDLDRSGRTFRLVGDDDGLRITAPSVGAAIRARRDLGTVLRHAGGGLTTAGLDRLRFDQPVSVHVGDRVIARAASGSRRFRIAFWSVLLAWIAGPR